MGAAVIKWKKGNYGLLRKYGGKIINPGVVETMPENEKIFLEQMRKITKNLSVERIFAVK